MRRYLWSTVDTRSPSHAVGLEPPRRTLLLATSTQCHHPTQWAWNKLYISCISFPDLKSPSHTVGLEQEARYFLDFPRRWKESPSHTAGLERYTNFWKLICKRGHHPTRWAWNWEVIKQETVLKTLVAIPHGGLRTSNDNINQNKTYQSFRQGGTLFKWN